MAYTHVAAALFTLVAAASAQQQNGTIFECTSEGRFPDPFDCTSFFTCVAETDGSFLRSKGDCKGYAFHPDLRTCVSSNKVPGCSSRKPKQLISDKSLSEICTGSAFLCGNCKTIVNCIGTEAYKDTTCDDGYSCSTSGSGSLSGTAACISNDRAEAECLCTSDDLNKPKPDPNSDKGFIFCPNDGGDAQIFKCAPSQMYNVEKQECVSDDAGEICTKQGTFKKEDCSGLYSCWYSPEGLVKRTFLSCDEGMMVFALEQTCTDPCSWPRSNHKCIAEGRFKDPTDCSKFVTCSETTAAGSGVFDQNIGQCPRNYLWDQTAAGGVGHCADADSVTCDPPVSKMSSCPIEGITCP